MDSIVELEFAKRLKEDGYSIPCEYFYQDIDLPYSEKGLKKTKNGRKMNHNNKKYGDFIISAPITKDAINWLIGRNIYYPSSLILLLGKDDN